MRGEHIITPAHSRDAAIPNLSRLQALYDFRCQFCGTRLECPGGPHIELVPIRPLEAPHDGAEDSSNYFVLCPNHAVLFLCGAIGVGNDLKLWGTSGVLMLKPEHKLTLENLAYHRKLHARHSRRHVTDEGAQSAARSPTDLTKVTEKVTSGSPLKSVFVRLQLAVEKAESKELMKAAETLEKLLDEKVPEKVHRIVTVLKVMGRVGDVANTPKIFNLLVLEMAAAGISVNNDTPL